MNREYKFRGQRVNNKEWVYGSHAESKHNTENSHMHNFILKKPMNEYPEDEEFMFEVIPETVGQYTGQPDRNEKEIYKGDIVKMHYFFENYDESTFGSFEDEEEIIGVVGIDVFGTYTEDKNGDKYYWLNYLQEPSEELEIIGNITDNPELLEAET